MGYPCVGPYILFYNHGSYFALVLSYVNIIFKSFPLRS